jgi:hypothetical protein
MLPCLLCLCTHRYGSSKLPSRHPRRCVVYCFVVDGSQRNSRWSRYVLLFTIVGSARPHCEAVSWALVWIVHDAVHHDVAAPAFYGAGPAAHPGGYGGAPSSHGGAVVYSSGKHKGGKHKGFKGGKHKGGKHKGFKGGNGDSSGRCRRVDVCECTMS